MTDVTEQPAVPLIPTAPLQAIELWQAAHDECGPACDGCAVVDLDLDDDLYAEAEQWAAQAGVSTGAFLHYLIRLGASHDPDLH